MLNKKSQLTIFILIGVSILIVTSFYYVIHSYDDKGVKVSQGKGQVERNCEIECMFQRDMDRGQCIPDVSKGKNKEQSCIDEIGDNGVYIDTDNFCKDDRFIQWICCCFNITN